MAKLTIKDFRKGSLAWIERIGEDAMKAGFDISACLYPAKVEKVGLDYVMADGMKFTESDIPAMEGLAGRRGRLMRDSFIAVLYPSYAIAIDHLMKKAALETLRDTLKDMRPEDTTYRALDNACRWLHIPLEHHRLSGYAAADKAIDSFCRGGCFKETPGFADCAKANIRLLYSEDVMMTMNEEDLYYACTSIKDSILQGKEIINGG